MNRTELITFLRKARQQLQFLHEYFYVDFTDITDLQLAADNRDDKRFEPKQADWQSVALGDTWSGRDSYYWLRFVLMVPELAAGEQYVLHTHLGRTGGGGNSGFEGLIFIDGEIQQALDSNHQDMYLDDSFGGKTLTVAIKLWTGLEGGGRPQIQHYTLAALSAGKLRPAVTDAYAYLKNIVGVIEELDNDTPIKYDYIRLVQESFSQLHWSNTDSAEVAKTCATILTQIKAFIAAHPNQKIPYTITAVGHTHIDVAWLWRLKHTREKITRSFSTVLELMKEYPDYIFFQSTPQDYAFLEKDHPELFARIKQRIAEDRWEANGGTWLEPDTNIPSGESLTRQFLYGGGYFKDRFNAKQNVLWLPDVFGYSAAMPQIMRGFNVNNFMTTKISWNDTNRMPHDTFYWQGIDGSKVLTHFITTVDATGEYKNTGNWAYTYNGDVSPHTVFGSYHVYADKGLNSDILLSYGFGDGGGGPTREQIQNVRILGELPGVPSVQQGRVDEYFDRLNQTLAPHKNEVATWRGELYLEFHRGTYTSQGWIKRANRRAEEALRQLEIRYATAWARHGVTYPREAIRTLWETLLRNQFHDILPGSSIHEVYEDARQEFAQLFETVDQLNAALDQQLTAPAETPVVYNPLAWATTQPVTLADGKQMLATVPALQAQALQVQKPEEAPTAVITGAHLQTAFYDIVVDASGQLRQLQDRHTKREYLDEATGGNVLTAYEDRPLEFDNWNIDDDYPQKATVLHADAMQVIENTPLSVGLQFIYHYGQSTITQTMRLYAHSRRIDFITHADWHEHQVLLRTAFNSTVLADNARFDIQYGNVLRPVNDNTSWDQAKFETVGHKWADLSERDYGLALLNDSKYGYRVKDRQLSLSLIKSGINPDYDADQGAHDFTYALLPHVGDWLAGGVEQAAAELNQPLQLTTPQALALAPLFEFAGEYPVAVDAIKVSEDGGALIVRLHDYTGITNQVQVRPTFAVQAAALVQLNEVDQLGDLTLQNGTYQLTVQPYQVVTLRIKL